MTDEIKNSEPNKWDIDNLPNRLTLFRVALIPIIVISLGIDLTSFEWDPELKLTLGYVAAWTFVAASITDFVDGYVARKKNIVTIFGSFLDPIADKFLVVTSLILLQALDRIPPFLVIILVLRELYMTSLRLLASDHGLSVPVNNLGKWKTATQMVAIPLLMAFDKPWGIPMPLIGTSLIYVAAFLSLYSALQYSLGLIKKIQIKRKNLKAQKSS